MKRISSFNVTSHIPTRKEIPVIGNSKKAVYDRCIEMERSHEWATPGIKQITEDGWTKFMAVMRLKDKEREKN